MILIYLLYLFILLLFYKEITMVAPKLQRLHWSYKDRNEIATEYTGFIIDGTKIIMLCT